MLVEVQRGAGADGDGLSGAEDHVVKMLRSWNGKFHLPGLALVNVNLPDKKGPRQVDALLFTPHGLLVIEVKGFTRAQPGTLEVPLNGPWTVDGQPAAVHTLAEAVNPGEQVKGGVYAAKNAFTAIDGGGDTFVTGLVILVHPTKGLVLGDTRNAGRGIRVVLATQTELRKEIHRNKHRAKVWSADGVLDACRTLGLTHLAPARAQLLAEGFPDLIVPSPIRKAVPPPFSSPFGEPAAAPNRAALSAPPVSRPIMRPTAAPAPKPVAANRASSSASRPSATRTAPPPRQPSSPPPDRPTAAVPPRVPSQRTPPRPRSAEPSTTVAPTARRRRIPWGLLIAITIILGIGVTVAVFVHGMFHGT